MIDKTGNPSMRRESEVLQSRRPAGFLSIIMDRLAFGCLLFLGLLNPLLSLPVTDIGAKTLRLPGEVTVFFFISSRCHSGVGKGFWLKGVFCSCDHALRRGSGDPSCVSSLNTDK